MVVVLVVDVAEVQSSSQGHLAVEVQAAVLEVSVAVVPAVEAEQVEAGNDKMINRHHTQASYTGNNVCMMPVYHLY